MARLALISVVAFVAMAVGGAPAGVAKKPKPPAPAGFELQILYQSFELNAGEKIDIFEVTCPKGWMAVDGGLESDPTKTDLSGSEPVRGTAGAPRSDMWQFDLQDKSGQAQIVTLWVACQRAKAVPAAGKKVVLRRSHYAIAPFAVRIVKSRCPSKKKSLGFGWSLLGPNPQPQKQRDARSADAEDDVRIVGVTPTAQGHDVTIAAGSAPVDANLTEVCYPETVTIRGGAKRRVAIDRERVTGSAPPGLSAIRAGCGRGRVALGAPGFSAGRELTIAPSLGADGDAQLKASNPTGGPLPLTIVASCTPGRLVNFRQTGVTIDTTTGPITITQGP